MKRKLLAGMTALCLSAALSVPAAAASRTVPVTINGVRLSAVSYLSNGVTSVPLRAFLNAAGEWNVSWNAARQQAEAEGAAGRITAQPGSYTLRVDDAAVTLPSPVCIENGATYLPLRTLCTALGWQVEWDSALQGAAVTTVSGQDAPSYSEEDLYWLSRIISAESRGESFDGQVAVGHVVLNRVASDTFPDTIKGVIFDDSYGVQFEPVSNGSIYDAPSAQSVAAARSVLSGCSSPIGESLYFYAPALSQGSWIRANRTYLTTIGCHRFYL